MPLSKLILEQEEEEGGLFDEEAEDTDEEEPAPDEDTEASADTGAAAEGEAGETAEAEIEAPDIKPEDEVRLGKQFDIAIDGMLMDFEADALKSAAIYSTQGEEVADEIATEWWKRSLNNLIFEQEAAAPGVPQDELDIDQFAEDVARLIQNYDSLMDIESIIYNKAISFLDQKYGPDVAAALEDALVSRHNLDFSSDPRATAPGEEVFAPLAIGTGGDGAAGGA